jgi:hypothetical protein
MVLLGAGNAGKTTVLKQFRMKYGNGFTPEERHATRQSMHRAYITAMQKLLYAVTDILTSDHMDTGRGAPTDFEPANKALAKRFMDLGDRVTILHHLSLDSASRNRSSNPADANT